MKLGNRLDQEISGAAKTVKDMSQNNLLKCVAL